ncbi:MAG TPA: archaemetzincin family Zn-dependent metalloprotease, partial [Oculatellaceae cyanobacterium]
MKIGVLAVGSVVPDVLVAVAHGVAGVFPDTSCEIIANSISVPTQAYDKKRGQYHSTTILNGIRTYAMQHPEFNRILGIIDADIYASDLNYVFGEAYISAKAGLISLWRLKPEFYKEEPDKGALQLRVQKEAIHELGHTLGLQHCTRSYCVMHFSNSIFEVDKKQSLFC